MKRKKLILMILGVIVGVIITAGLISGNKSTTFILTTGKVLENPEKNVD